MTGTAGPLYRRIDYETYVPAEQAPSCQDPRFPCPHGNQGRSQCSQGPPRQGSQAPLCVAALPACEKQGVVKGTIKAKSEVERLFRDGRRSTSYLLTLLVKQTDDSGRCAFIAGKKLGIAPLRSRCKRVMREVARELGGPWDGFDVVFVARKKVAHAPHDKVVRQMRRQLRESGVIDGK